MDSLSKIAWNSSNHRMDYARSATRFQQHTLTMITTLGESAVRFASSATRASVMSSEWGQHPPPSRRT